MKIEEKTSPEGLNYLATGTSPAKLTFVPGLFGAGRNWMHYLRFLWREASLPAASIDQRGHGKSPNFEKEPTLQILADDLARFLESQTDVPSLLVGHSLGGKVAILLASQRPELVERLMVVDTGPKAISQDSFPPFDWMKAVKVPVPSRQEARKELEKWSEDQRLVDFLLTNLEEEGGSWTWKIDLVGLEQLVENLKSQDLWEEWEKIEVPLTLVRGEKSFHLSSLEAREMLESHRVRNIAMEVVEDAGHWCHVDNRDRFEEILMDFVEQDS